MSELPNTPESNPEPNDDQASGAKPSAASEGTPGRDPARQPSRESEHADPIEPIPADESDGSAIGEGPLRRARRRDGQRRGALPIAAQQLLQSLREPWLLAAWPGMGGVAAIAAGHMAQTLGAQPVGMLSLADHFPLDGVDVQHGIARANPTPRCLLLAWKDPKQKRDLLLLLGEAQPPNGGADICRKIMDMAQARGVARVLTFAAMGSQVDPRDDPRVLGATTAPKMLEELATAEIERLPQGKVTGLNGALLAVAAERNVPAACLLGEMPIFAAGMPNPRASLAIVNAFSRFSDLDINVDALVERASEMQPQLDAMHEQIQRLGQNIEEAGEEFPADDEPEKKPPTPPERPSRDATPRVDDHAREHIERLFTMAKADREHAQRLKQELDRLGLFNEYEDRFLDLFRSPS